MDIIQTKGYRVIQPLASGGEGQVSICEKDGARFIIKAVPSMDSRQSEILSQVNALPGGFFPHVYETFCDAEHTYLIREYIEGNTLREELQRNGSLSYPRALRIFNSLCEALNVLHHATPQPIVLRDLKPENIILTPDGGVSLIDFGIARHYSPLARRDTVPAGTKGYTAPEAMTGFQSDPRSDVYSLGIVLYEMLCGKNLSDPPFQLRPLSESGVFAPASLDRVLAKVTDPKPICRFSSVAAFQSAMKRVRPQKPIRSIIVSGALCFLLGASLTVGIMADGFDGLFRGARPVAAASPDSVSVVGLPLDKAEELLRTQGVPILVYGVVDESAGAGEVVSLSTASDGITLEVCVGRPADKVLIPDPAVESTIRDILGIPAGQSTTAADLLGLTVLDISNQGVTSLEGLQFAVNLTQLTADGNEIADLSPIANLGRLRTLYLSDNAVSDLTPLLRLRNLKTLYLENNRVSDLSALENIDLYDLSLGANEIADLSPLANAVHMQRLNLHGNRISDISALQSMPLISWLSLNANQITDLAPLSRLTALETLLISHNAVYDSSPIATNTGLTQLDLSSNYITDISPLSSLTRLESLDLSANTRLSDLSATAALQNLRTLGVAYLEDGDYSPLLSLPALRTVTFCSPQSVQNGEHLSRVIEQLQNADVQVLFQ